MIEQTQQPDKALAAAEPTNGAMIVANEREQQQLASVFGGLIGGEVNNFDGDIRRRWQLTGIACGPAAKGRDDAVGQVLAVKYYYAHRVEIVDIKTGEVNSCVRVVLMTPELDAYAFVSGGIARDVARMVNAFGNKPFDPPIACKVAEVTTRAGYRTLVLQPVI